MLLSLVAARKLQLWYPDNLFVCCAHIQARKLKVEDKPPAQQL
jgi:hypothetical protein